MEKQADLKKMRLMLLCGMLGCLLMGGSDWLMIYGDTAYEGSLAWLTVGVSQIEPWRNALALLLAFPAVIFYAIALFGLARLLTQPQRRVYSALTAVGLTPWLCLHLFYIMILYLFGWMTGNGQSALGLEACEALFGQFSWVIPLAELFMLLPFLYILYAFAAKKSVFPRAMAINNPLILLGVLKLLTGFLPDTAFRLAFTNGLMSESMLLWFVLLLVFLPKDVR